MADEQVKDWGEWNRKWQRTITAQSSFEWHFAKDVIQKVSGLGPNNVTPQQSFIANDGRERHMDFAIEIDGVKIAIEVEGWDKTGENRGKNKREHDEFNRRIQSLTSQGWRVLTVTNAQFKRDPIQYIADINKILFEEQTKLQSNPSTTTEKIEEVEESKKSEQTPNEERNVKPLYALVGLAAIAVLGVAIGVVIWAMTRDSDTVVILDRIEETDRQDSATDSSPADEEAPVPTVQEAPVPSVQEAPVPSVQEAPVPTVQEPPVPTVQEPPVPTVQEPPVPTVQEPPVPTVQEAPVPTVQEPPAPTAQPAPESEVSEQTYLTKNRVDIRIYEDSQGDVDCGYLPEAAKPVWLSDPDVDPYYLDGWLGERGNAWACGIPTYFTTDFDWDFEKWEDATGDVDCGDIPEYSKPIFLTNPEIDPYRLDGWGVGDGVGCLD